MTPFPRSLRRPLGLALAGGGAFGSWQTAAVRALAEEHGLVFDAVLGVSAGAVTAASYCLDRMDEAVARWHDIDNAHLLRLAPRLRPLALCSARPLWEWVGEPVDEERARREARCHLVVVSACPKEKRTIYAVFDRQRGRWDGPLGKHLVASCSIPTIFPPVEAAYQGKTLTLVDGGMPGREPFSLAELSACKDVIIVEMSNVGADGRPRKTWLQRLNEGRKRGRDQMREGINSLQSMADAPRLFQLTPSRPLSFEPLSFKSAHVERSLELGRADARAFAADPDAYSLTVPAGA